MMERSKLLMELKPFFLRWVQQGVDAGLMGPALHKILVFHADGSAVEAFEATSAGLDAALAAAVSGDVIQAVVGTIAGDHTVGAGVEVVGRGRENSIFSGQITLSDGAVLRELSVVRSAAQAGDLIGVVAPASGMAYVVGCDLMVNNATGDGFACYGDLTHLTLRWCSVSAQSAGADSNPFADGGYILGAQVDTFAVDSANEGYTPGTYATQIGMSYLVCVEGTWFYSASYQRDAMYYTQNNWATHLSDVYGYVQFEGEGLSDADDTTYSATHSYDYTRAGDGAVVSLRLWDSLYTDNTGSATITVYALIPIGGTPNVHGCVIPNADGRAAAIPEWGDRSAWDVADYGDRHAGDWAAGDSHHAAATLAVSADVLLGLSGQELSLDTQAANTVLAGPVSGAAVAPTFRALGNADLPDPLAFKTAASALGIVSGAVTATQNLHTITSETGTTDDLATITAAADRTLLLLQATATHTITVKHGAGNISLNGAADFALSGDKALLLFWTGAAWADLGAGGGGGALADHDHTVGAGDGGVLSADEHDSYSEYAEIADPDTPAGNKVRLYVKDKGGVATLYYRKDDGNIVEVGGSTSAGGYTEGARVRHSANQSIANNTPTVLTFDTEGYDTDGIYDAGSPTRLTCQTAGKYLIFALATFAYNAATGKRHIIRLKLNNTTEIGSAEGVSGGGNPGLTAVTTYNLSVGDYVEVTAYQDTGGALNIVSEGLYSPAFMMQRIG